LTKEVGEKRENILAKYLVLSERDKSIFLSSLLPCSSSGKGNDASFMMILSFITISKYSKSKTRVKITDVRSTPAFTVSIDQWYRQESMESMGQSLFICG